MEIYQLVDNSKQRIYVWSNDARKWAVLDSLFLSVHKHSEANEDCADFLTATKRHYEQVFRPDEEYDFTLHSSRPDRLKLKDGIWVFPPHYEKDVIHPNRTYFKEYAKYREIAKIGGLI